MSGSILPPICKGIQKYTIDRIGLLARLAREAEAFLLFLFRKQNGSQLGLFGKRNMVGLVVQTQREIDRNHYLNHSDCYLNTDQFSGRRIKTLYSLNLLY